MRVLVVEDDDRLAAALSDVLRQHGFDVDRVGTGADALGCSGAADIVLLDLGLPDLDGMEVCRRLRARSDVPVIIVTARSEQTARLHGLNLGADDYLVKPFDLRELVARIHAVTRRTARAAPGSGTGTDGADVLVHGDLRIDVRRREVLLAGDVCALTAKEFDLLVLLAREPGVVFRREQILAEVWGAASPTTGPAGVSHTLDVHVASLRAKTGVPGVVETVRGVGYRLGSPEPPAPAGG